MRPSFLQDLTGQKFGRLIVLRMSEKRTSARGGICVCKCECGAIKEIPSLALQRGLVVSCGCYASEVNKARCTKHGHESHSNKTLTYRSWDKMIQRCTNPNAHEYKFYGARGIVVCDRWKDFSLFLKDMGERPSKFYSIDRINCEGNYEPGNCRWADRKTQGNNTRRNVYYEYNGEKKTIAELAEIAGVKYDTMFYRLKKYGWSVEHAITVPVTKSNTRKGY